jgi:L-seryl-tRNA(Ser) seleniumtransferase
MGMGSLSQLPSVEKILQTEEAAALSDSYGRPLTLRAVRQALQGLRSDLKERDREDVISISSILQETGDILAQWARRGLRPVINATGVILHTNLGRAPLSHATIAAMGEIADGYSNVELDLETGKRGARSVEVEGILRMLTGAEAALVVNNNAAAVLLILSGLAARKRVAIARSQLVEIGGGFRMPDVMRQSGARLVEVGTTNKVRLSDYEEVFAETQVVLRVHRSNFKIVGFTSEPDLRSIADAGHHSGQIVVDDLGSGALMDTSRYGLKHEPTVQESLEAGADIVCFSGDKLLGGPQAGIIIGQAALLAKLAKHPLARAIRADKMSLAGLRATLNHYLLNEAETEIPVWQMISAPLAQIEQRALDWAHQLGQGEVIASESTLGGGSLPGETLPTKVLALRTASPDALLIAMRRRAPPVIARAERGRVLLDPRTVSPRDDKFLVAATRAALMEMR